jgi:protein TonB
MKTQETKGTEVNSITRSAREDKKNVNIKPRTVRYFQFGLLIGLFAVLLILEMNFGFVVTKDETSKEINLDEETTYVFTLETLKPIVLTEQPPQKIATQKKIISSNVIETTKNDSPLTESPIQPTEELTNQVTTVVSTTVTPAVTPVESTSSETKNMISVEFVPVFPGCERFNSNNEKIACMSSNINAFIERKFRTSDFDYLAQGEVQKIYVQFTIDTKGVVTDIKARAPDKKLENEAKRVISLLPTMKPGKQGNNSVNVQYSIPIIFQVSN